MTGANWRTDAGSSSAPGLLRGVDAADRSLCLVGRDLHRLVLVGFVTEGLRLLRGGLLERILERLALTFACGRAGRIGLGVHGRLQRRIARNSPYAAWPPRCVGRSQVRK